MIQIIKEGQSQYESLIPFSHLDTIKEFAKKNNINNDDLKIYHVNGRKKGAIGIFYQLIIVTTDEKYLKEYDFSVIKVETLQDMIDEDKRIDSIMNKYTKKV